ncbi:hypothetical protein X942_5804 [Burkholderia pseudomallei MSHR5596]|nr:hypothetical protein X942_5804 [Burkholderia pseudomallei MSHR5596]
MLYQDISLYSIRQSMKNSRLPGFAAVPRRRPVCPASLRNPLRRALETKRKHPKAPREQTPSTPEPKNHGVDRSTPARLIEEGEI